jgi:hypothetical protein
MQMSVQIICPSVLSAELAPRISFSSSDAIEADDSMQEIGLIQAP